MDLITTYVSDDDLRRLNWHQQSAFPTDDSIAISETISSTINPFTALNCALNQEITVALYLALVVDGNFETQISSFYEHEVKRSSYRHYSSGGRTATTALSLGRTPAPQMNLASRAAPSAGGQPPGSDSEPADYPNFVIKKMPLRSARFIEASQASMAHQPSAVCETPPSEQSLRSTDTPPERRPHEK
ncbi:hypothetical protein [Neorhizobium sp. T7_12]|uniref:hypothetical protein n=1 Tax=Neorhizobium sp. T7_12 TaxID=2093832 RepID=UPI00155E90E6|nr:hypothetical protein [Neorhizobium sp. T7_12]